MPVPDPSFGWQDATAAFAIIAFVAFLVTWVVTYLGHVSRTRLVGYVVQRPCNGGMGLGHPRRTRRSRGGCASRASSARKSSP